ncbi:MAG TPA: hypothetical protein PKC43_05510 [Phycisphaerales bacterium]|nr:hypothetical protein [Phycisphaerales bacterium]HMP36888.1 hypothetical protein [Phycisphaerales bacterium]
MQTHHEEMTAERLREAPLLVSALERELSLPPIHDESKRIDRLMASFCDAPGSADKVIARFQQIRRALGEAVRHCDASTTSEYERVTAAAVALYLRCAFHLIDVTIGTRVIRVPTDERLICAIIGAALSGGRLEVDLDGGGPLPSPDGTPAIRVPERGDQWWFAFEVEVYRVVMDDDPDAPAIAERGVPFDDRQRAALHARLRSMTQVHRAAFTLVVHGFTDDARAEAFTKAHGVHIAVPSLEENAASAVILGMSVHDLLYELVEFFKEVRGRGRRGAPAGASSRSDGARRAPREPAPSSSAAPPTSPGPTHSFTVNVHAGRDAATTMAGGVAQTGQGHQAGSGDQSGTGNQQGTGNRLGDELHVGVDLAPILAAIEVVRQELGAISDPRAKVRLETKVEELEEALSSSPAPEPRRLKALFEGIKTTAETINAGGAIVKACSAAIGFLAKYVL